MNELAFELLMRLARTTLFLSVAVVTVAIALRFVQLRSAHLRRLLAVVALLQGVLWTQAPITVPWYAPAAETVEIVEPPLSETLPMPGGGVAIPPPPSLPATPTVAVEKDSRVQAMPTPPEPATAASWNWPLLLCCLWALGIVVIVVTSIWRYVAFVRGIPPAREIEPQWLEEYEQARSAINVEGRLRFQVTGALGPLLCWTPRGSLLLVPAGLWRELTIAQRVAILRHELAHFKRHDLFTSLLVRMLAMPHWFNPLAWWVVREFEEAGEWICDGIAAGNSSTEYAGALVRLCEPPSPIIWPTTAARGSGVAARVRRLLDTQTKEDSIMKKLMLAGTALALLVAGIVRVELVAQLGPEGRSKSESNAAPNAERAAKQKAMIDAAQQTLAVMEENFKLGSGLHSNTDVYLWSNYLRTSQIRAAGSREEATKACQEHLDRMKQLHDGVAALQREGARGGEADKFFATQFYVAEAELLLLEAKNNEKVPGLPRNP
jgi:beta-lactamase regulating signal transducer with metallopeptidase domain